MKAKSRLHGGIVREFRNAVVVAVIMMAAVIGSSRVQAQQSDQPVQNPDVFLKSTPSTPAAEQKRYEDLLQQEQYARDKADPRRQTECI